MSDRLAIRLTLPVLFWTKSPECSIDVSASGNVEESKGSVELGWEDDWVGSMKSENSVWELWSLGVASLDRVVG